MTRRVAAAVLTGLLLALAWCGPASAHGADAPVAADYRVVVGEVSVPGVTVRAVEGGARLELTNESGRQVTVLGLQGEEFLRVRPGGVDENRRSPTWFASRSLTGTARGGDAAATPEWHTIATEPVVRWHDERARELPARAWSVPLLVDGREPGIVRGTIVPAPAPPTGWWWAGALVAAVLVAGLYRWRWALVAVAVVAGGLTVAWIVDSAALATSPADALGTQLLARLWPLVTGAGVVAAGIGLAFRRIDIVVAIAGACLAVMVGFAESAVFREGVLAGPGWGRWAVASALAGGLGLAVAGSLRWYRTVGIDD
ncbi:hypothetical protein ABZS66_39135 [Dactylosporangium sp. NPDC005572]|uniref:hypothetical protein n=1 Tax=Dactylosporangium sp. NPDC005572 TaxID=3156889 RepID=UPI0033A816CB